jgi:hypothetical protein
MNYSSKLATDLFFRELKVSDMRKTSKEMATFGEDGTCTIWYTRMATQFTLVYTSSTYIQLFLQASHEPPLVTDTNLQGDRQQRAIKMAVEDSCTSAAFFFLKQNILKDNRPPH